MLEVTRRREEEKKMRKEKILKIAKGYRGRGKNCITIAARRVTKGLQHAYRHRREKKREMRALWIHGINAGLHEHGYNYSRFICQMDKGNLQLNRKVLHDMAQTEPFSFRAVVEVIRHLELDAAATLGGQKESTGAEERIAKKKKKFKTFKAAQ